MEVTDCLMEGQPATRLALALDNVVCAIVKG
jgi:hypothetical protein